MLNFRRGFVLSTRYQRINPISGLAFGRNGRFFSATVHLQASVSHPHKRLQHLAGRYLLPFLFSDFPLTDIEIASTRKPFLPQEQYHFSISHCGDFAAAIVSKDQQVGIDIEMITERVHKIKHKYLHPSELDL